jgi:hypothetical protein
MVRIKMGGYVDDDGKIMTESYKQVWEKKVATRTKEITRLEAENARLREALKHISVGGPTMPRCCIDAGKAQDLTNHLIEVAEEALNNEK